MLYHYTNTQIHLPTCAAGTCGPPTAMNVVHGSVGEVKVDDKVHLRARPGKSVGVVMAFNKYTYVIGLL